MLSTKRICFSSTKKNVFFYLVTWLLLFCYNSTGAQTARRTCGSMPYLEKQQLLYPEIKAQRAVLNQKISEESLRPKNITSKGTAVLYTIPVVVHVVYNTAGQNISDAQILSQIEALNLDYQLKNADTGLVPAIFKGAQADMQIQFCLAKRDPSNAPTTGITRTSTSLTSFIDDDKVKSTAAGGHDAWPRNKYLNLWVCNMPSLLGYAQFPGGPAATDGVVIHYTAFGTTGTLHPVYNKGRTTTHEIGHWLGLLHTFEGGCSGPGDFVSDTPPQQAENYGCPSFPRFSCSGTVNGDMYMNFMDYVNDNCMQMFSAGQKYRTSLMIGAYPALDSITRSQGCMPVAPVNDNALAATLLIPGTGCTNAPYTNVNATQATDEPFPSCATASGTHTVWFKFTAPAGGAVRISTDMGTGNTLTDTYIALFSATSAADYRTFRIISCDDNGGSSTGNTLSVLYATGLTAGQTYYIAADGNSGSTGSFCIAVDELSGSMLSAAGCSSTYKIPAGNTPYSGWIPLMDNNSKLIAMVRNNAGSSVSGYTVSQYINTGTARNGINGRNYLDRNYLISNAAVTNADVRLFFPAADLTTLNTASPGNTLSSLFIAHQPGNTCVGDFNAANGNVTMLPQTDNGSANGVSWIQFTTPGFSGFYITGNNNIALPVTIDHLTATNNGTTNLITWTCYTASPGISYTLEKSTDGQHFEALAVVPGRQNEMNYAVTDEHPAAGTTYYRLHVSDANGNSYYTRVVSAEHAAGHSISLQAVPNPAGNMLQVMVSGTIIPGATITLTDLTGKELYTTAAANMVNIGMHRYPAGIYFIRYTALHNRQWIKISKL